MLRRLLPPLAIALCTVAFATAAQAAAPRYILVSGAGLARPVTLADWRENLALEQAIAAAPRAAPDATAGGRPRLRLSLFWGWGEQRPRSLAGASQRGWLYPAVGSRPALLALRVNGSSALRIADAPVLRILRRHGVPVRSLRPAA